MPEHFHIAITFGLLLGAALIGSLLAEVVRIPKVTAYLLVGLVLGPHAMEVIPLEHAHSLEPFTKFAMALVLFDLGCNFPLTHIRRIFRRIVWLSFGELLATFTLVTIGLIAIGEHWSVALLLGTLALATAPATTTLVLHETQSEGPVTDLTGGLVAINNFACIIAFELAFLLVAFVRGSGPPPAEQFELLFRDIAGSICLGLFAGVVVSFLIGLLKEARWLVMLMAITTVVLGVCETVHMPYMLTFLAMGMMVANTSEFANVIRSELDRMTALLCVLFFVIHGAELDVNAFLNAGVVGGAYIVWRCVGKYFGIRFAAKIVKEDKSIQKYLGGTLLAQAGAAIALASIAAYRDPELGESIKAVILGSVVFFEIIGPLAIRRSVLQAGEVPLAQALHHTETSPLAQLVNIFKRLKHSLGMDPASQFPPSAVSAGDVMRKSFDSIKQTASFDEVVRVIEHSHENTYPVVDDEQRVVGVISYVMLSDALFDPQLGSLVRAEDLATQCTVISEDAPASELVALFRQITDDCIPVVSSGESPKLVGVVRRADIRRMVIRDHRGVGSDSTH